MSKGTTVTMFSRSNDTLASNVGAKEAWGHKKRENLFINSFVGTSSGGVSYVNSKTRSTNDVQGKIINTGVVSDMAIDGAGLLVVSETTTGPAKFTRRGDFRQDELGFWKNGADQLLRAWKLDNDENLPQGASLLESLEAVNFANTKGSPVATTVVSIAMNLNEAQEALRGNGVDAIMNRTGINSANKTGDILFPEKFAGSSLSLGDQFNFTSSDGVIRPLTFGGMVLARRPDAATNSTIFGATGANPKFTFSAVPGAGLLVSGQGVRITVDGQTFLFSATQASESPTTKTFNTISGLAAAIDRISSLKAKVDSLGRLYIAPTNPNSAVTFTDVGVGGNIVSELGLVNLALPDPGVTRFNSLDTLRDAVNANQDIYSLKATIEGKDIKITSLLSTSSLDVTASVPGTNIITRATQPIGDMGRGSVVITAPGNNLATGDFIQITGATGQAQLPAGLYYVSARTPNGFTINRKGANPALFPAAAVAPVDVPINANVTWQKVQGQQFQQFGGSTVSAAVGGANGITITIPGGQAATGVFPAEAWVNGDVVYISGVAGTFGGQDFIVPAGYYEIAGYVNAPGAGASTFTITATANVGAAGAPPAGPFIVRKVATGGVAAMDTRTFVTVGGNAAPNSAVRMYMPNHGYNVGDEITFKNLAAPLVMDGITINNNVKYKITAINQAGFGGNASPSIEFKVFNNAVPPVEVAATAGDGDTGAVDLVAGLPGFAINNDSQLMNYFSIDPDKVTYDATYDANDANKNLSSAANGITNFKTNLTYSVPITVYDSLGSSYTLLLYFAKLDDNKWAIELTSKKDKDGQFEVRNVLANTNGLIKKGIIEFDKNGKIKGIPEGFAEAIQVQHNNKSALGNITIDWENTMSDITSGTVSQTKNPNNVEIIQGDGQGAGTLTKLEISPEGYIIGTFSTGETRKLYKVPMAIFANVNGLIAGSNGTFDVSRESGELLLKEAGIGGAGRTLGGVLEASNVDTTEELLKVQELSNSIRANARVASIDNENFRNILSELRGG